jgi:hypothetical protein
MFRRLDALFVMIALTLTPISVDAKIGEFTGDDYFRECTTTNPEQRPKMLRIRSRSMPAAHARCSSSTRPSPMPCFIIGGKSRFRWRTTSRVTSPWCRSASATAA